MSTPSLEPRTGSGKTSDTRASNNPGAPTARKAVCHVVTWANAPADAQSQRRPHRHRQEENREHSCANRSRKQVHQDRERDNLEGRAADAHERAGDLDLVVRSGQARGDRGHAPDGETDRQQPRTPQPVGQIADRQARRGQAQQQHRRQPARLNLGEIELLADLGQHRRQQPAINRVEQVHREEEQRRRPTSTVA